MEKEYFKDIQELSDKLINFLEQCNVKIPKLQKEQSFYSLLNKLDRVVAIRKDKTYYGVETDSSGYIKKIIDIDGIIEKMDIPSDINKGYYRYENGNFILDERMKEEIWG